MNRIDRLFAEKKRAGKKSLILYLTAGYPALEVTAELLARLPQWGCDLIELGVPFSDPIADGPTIQYSSSQALKNGTSLKKILQLLPAAREQTDAPIVLFSALNPFLKYGLENLTADAAQLGADGLLVPDLPPEEGSGLAQLCAARKLTLTFLLAPTSPPERIRLVAERSSGFIYYISLRGVTGAREQLARDLDEKIALIRKVTDKPLVVGFGVSNAQQARRVAAAADGVVVGSALIEQLRTVYEQERLAGEAALARVENFVRALADAI